MALIPCPDCGKQISTKAITCPQCGAPNERSVFSNVKPENTSVQNEPLEPLIKDGRDPSPVECAVASRYAAQKMRENYRPKRRSKSTWVETAVFLIFVAWLIWKLA